MPVPFHQDRHAGVGQLGAIRQGKSLDFLAVHESLDGPIVDFVMESSKVQAANHLMIWERRIGAQRSGDISQVCPFIALRAMPENSHAVDCPIVRYQHAVSQVRGGTELAKNRNQ